MADIAKRKWSSEPTPEVAEALALTAQLGNAAAAARELGKPEATVREWRRRYRPLYEKMASELAEAVSQRIALNLRELANSIGETQALALQRTHERLQQDRDGQPAVTLRNLAVTQGVAVDKDRLIREKATTVIETRTAEAAIARLRAKAIDVEVVEES